MSAPRGTRPRRKHPNQKWRDYSAYLSMLQGIAYGILVAFHNSKVCWTAQVRGREGPNLFTAPPIFYYCEILYPCVGVHLHFSVHVRAHNKYNHSNIKMCFIFNLRKITCIMTRSDKVYVYAMWRRKTPTWAIRFYDKRGHDNPHLQTLDSNGLSYVSKYVLTYLVWWTPSWVLKEFIPAS
jgi:hypothetical protein